MSLSRPVIVALVLIAATLLVLSCASAPPPNDNKGRNPRAVSPYSPIVDVYVVGDHCMADPDSIFAHARAGKSRGGNFIPSVINWFGPAGSTLHIEMKDAGQQCLRKDGPQCNGDHCVALTNVNYNGSGKAECKYKVWIDGQQVPTDPVVVVDNCCDNLY